MNRNPIGRKALSLLLSLTLVLSIFGMDTAGAFAVQSSDAIQLSIDSGNILITDSGYFVGGGNKKDSSAGGYVISGSTNQNTISVTGSGICTQVITIQNINIDVHGTDGACAFSIAKGAAVSLKMEGNNTLKSGTNRAGLEVPGDGNDPPVPANNASLTVTDASTGWLTATGGYEGAGIGGNNGNNGNKCGIVEISGGTVTATGGYDGAGIGGGGNGRGGNITINGGNVTAIGDGAGAGIGGGYYNGAGKIFIHGGMITATGGGGSGGNVTIDGGTVAATGENGGAGIGGGQCVYRNGGGGCDVSITGSDTQVKAQGNGGYDIGSGEKDPSSGSLVVSGGNLVVSGGATVAMVNTGTNAVNPPQVNSQYTNCHIILNNNGTLKDTFYNDSGTGIPVTLLTATLTAQPAAGGQTGPIQFTAKAMNGSTPVTDGTFTFAYSGAKDSGNIPNADSVSISQDGTASCTWTPPTDGLSVITAKYKATGYDALKAVFYYDPDAIDLSATGSGGFGYTYGSNTFTINQNGAYVFTGITSGGAANKIAVASGVSADVTLRDASIDVSRTSNACAFSIAAGAKVNLTLEGQNTLKSGEYCAGLQVPGDPNNPSGNAFLTIGAPSDSDSLTATGGSQGAGIGGGNNSAGGSITINGGKVEAIGYCDGAGIGGGFGSPGSTVEINGGTVMATGGERGAGIGGGNNGAGGNITVSGGNVTANGGSDDGSAGIGGGCGGAGGTIAITGGTVMATGGCGNPFNHGYDGGAGIGGGCDGTGGTIYISGGSVKAAGSNGGEAIGKGCNGNPSGTLQNNSTDCKPVYLTTVTLPSKSADGVSALTLTQGSSAVSYGITDMKADADGKLYLYLPADSGNEKTTVDITADNTAYTGYYGRVTSAGNPNVLKMDPTLTVNSFYRYGDTISPAVSGSSSGVSFSYSGRNGTAYASTVTPSNCGDYTVSAVAAETDAYYGKTLTGDFSIGKADASVSLSVQPQNGVHPGDSAALTATVTGVTGHSPTGGVTFYDGVTVLGTETLSNGIAAYPWNNVWAGSHTLKASYSGDGNYNPVSGIPVPVNVTAPPAPSSPVPQSSHETSAPSLPTSVADTPTSTTIDLSGATFPAWVTSVSLSVAPEAANGAPSAPGNTGIPSDPQGAAVYHLVISQTNLNLIGSPFVYNIKLLDQNGNPITSFSGTVTVKVAIPAGIHGTPHIFRYEESTGTFTDLGATVENGFLVFQTTHFSYYVIAGTGDSVMLDTKSYQLPVGGTYQIGLKLTGSKAASMKVTSTIDKIATAARLKNGNVLVNGKGVGTAYIMIDVYDNKNHLLTHASVRVDVKTGIRPWGDSTRQIGVF